MNGKEKSLAKRAFAASLLALTAASPALSCGGGGYAYIKPGYERGGRCYLKRIALRVLPASVSNENLNRLLAELALSHLRREKAYLVYAMPRGLSPDARAGEFCKGDKRLNGVLSVRLRKLRVKKSKALLGVQAFLHDCDGERIWEAYAEKELASDIPEESKRIAYYRKKIGREVGTIIAPANIVLRETLLTLPRPYLSFKDKKEMTERESKNPSLP